MRKKGLSTVVATIMLVLLIVIGIMLIWIAIFPLFDNWFASAETTAVLVTEKLLIPYVGKGDNSGILDVEIKRGKTELMTIEVENVTELVNRTVYPKIDVMLLVDLSGSMNFHDCTKSSDGSSLVYAGSWCDSSEDRCEQTGWLGHCKGTYSDGKCVGATGNYNELSCAYSKNLCTDDCDGIYDSNSETSLEILKESASDFIDNILATSDNISIALMGFGGNKYPFLDFTNESNLLYNEISDWQANGGTPLLSGMKYAFGNFTDSDAEEKILIVLGDGAITSDDGSVEEAMDYAKTISDEGVTVHSIGFGSDADTTLFQGIASNGSGIYYDASDVTELTNKFTDFVDKVNVSRLVSYEVSLPGVFLDIAIFSEGNSYIHRIKRDLPGSNEGRTYEIELENGWVFDNVTKVEVYLVAVSSGGVYNSVLLSTYDLR